jgi:hypothetical protein
MILASGGVANLVSVLENATTTTAHDDALQAFNILALS